MNKQMLKLAGLGIGVVSMVVLLSIPVFAEEEHHGRKMHMAATTAPASAERHSMHEMHMKRLDEALKAIDKAVKAIEADNKDKALAELNKAKHLVAACNKAMSQMCKEKVVNTRCPIMGTKLDSDEVAVKLTRVYRGKTIGLCCDGCPAVWDKLSAEEKAKKLIEPAPPVKAKHDSHGAKKEHHGH